MKRSKTTAQAHQRVAANPFPIIKRLQDVLPAIQGRHANEFKIKTDQEQQYTVVTYGMPFGKVFDLDETDVMDNYGQVIPKGLMRRELRGLVFNATTGDLMSRPFHKFFNIGERHETQMEYIDMDRPHVVMEKMDGSMIRPIRLPDTGEIRFATKGGITETSQAAEKVMASWNQDKQRRFQDFLETCMNNGLTPIFEYIAPENRIVVEYDHSDLILLAIRNNETGIYLSTDAPLFDAFKEDGFPIVPQFGSVQGTLNDYIAKQRTAQFREGDVLRVDQEFYKIKNDWYLRSHKVKGFIRRDRSILALLLQAKLDDILPSLSEMNQQRVMDYEKAFYSALNEKVALLETIAADLLEQAGTDRKLWVKELLPARGLDQWESSFILRRGPNKSIYDLVMDFVERSIGKPALYDKLAAWLGLQAIVDTATGVDD